MKSANDILIGPETSILDAIRTIEKGALQIALVVDEQQRLIGTLTDGDVRRGLLRGISLDQAVHHVMNVQPRKVSANSGREGALVLMRNHSIHQIPVVGEDGRVIGIEWLDDSLPSTADDTWVVLMLGGLGTRLRPLTEDVPKPMLPVGGRPLVETIIRNFVSQGYRRFFFSVNYKAEVFRDYFGDGARFGADIQYLNEEKRLGTAGALSLLSTRPQAPMIVMNGDLLTSINFEHLLAFHSEHGAQATMCVREYTFQVPYGVVQSDGARLTAIVEKPEQNFFVNAGIYVVEPSALDLIPQDQFFDMPQLFEKIIATGGDASVFPIREYWLDIGRFDDLDRARAEFEQVFD